jgi:hypothetical protein
MFGWFKKRDPTSDSRSLVISEFRELRAEIERANPVEKLSFQITLALNWNTFVANHGSPGQFAKLTRDEQIEYLNKMIKLRDSYAKENNKEHFVPLQMLSIYIAAIIDNDRDLELEAAGFLDEHARRGHQMLPLLGLAPFE